MLLQRYLARASLVRRNIVAQNRLMYRGSGVPSFIPSFGAAAITLGATTLSSAAAVTVKATGANTLGAMTAAGAGTAGVPVDGPFNAYLPNSSDDWTALGLPIPDFQWNFTATSGDITPTIGAHSLTTEGTGHLYQQTVSGWTAKAVGFGDAADGSFYSTHADMDVDALESFAELLYYGIDGTTADRPICVMGSSSWQLESVGDTRVRMQSPASTQTLALEEPFGYTVDKSFIRPILFGRNATVQKILGVEASSSSATINTDAIAGDHGIGAIGGATEAMRVLLWARWRGANADTMLALSDLADLGWPEFWPFE